MTTLPSYQSMVGIRKLSVTLFASDEAKTNGFDEDAALTDISLRFRVAGIPIQVHHVSPFVKDEPLNEPGEPNLLINMETFKHGGLYFYYITAQFKQFCLLQRNALKKIHATTWQETKMGTVGTENVSQLRQAIKDLTDAFINAYLTMNPKKG